MSSTSHRPRPGQFQLACGSAVLSPGGEGREGRFSFWQTPLGGFIVLGMMVCSLMGRTRAAGAEAVSFQEHPVKAAFIYNFFKFVEWPASRFQETNAPLLIGVVGRGPITAALEAAVQDRKINGRNLLVQAVATPEEARAAHLLFVAATEDKQLDKLLKALATSSVLTVGESEAFARQGGMICFVLENGKIRFEINMDSAQRAGVKVSAQLQKLARTVRRTP
ncbi:MAG: YfiR family protein [Verrucomicrobia bacterium]|nr:YfiR family protein [Verrucomicrobiota bacterium]